MKGTPFCELCRVDFETVGDAIAHAQDEHGGDMETLRLRVSRAEMKSQLRLMAKLARDLAAAFEAKAETEEERRAIRAAREVADRTCFSRKLTEVR